MAEQDANVELRRRAVTSATANGDDDDDEDGVEGEDVSLVFNMEKSNSLAAYVRATRSVQSWRVLDFEERLLRNSSRYGEPFRPADRLCGILGVAPLAGLACAPTSFS
jgi:hypothetical protein